MEDSQVKMVELRTAPTELLASRGRRVKRRPRRKLVGIFFVLPAVVLFAVFGVYPTVFGLLLSFARWNGFSPDWSWIGVQNYLDLFGANPVVAPGVAQSGLNTLLVMVALPVVVVVVGLLLAVLLNSITRFRAVLRTLYFLPYVTAGIAVFYAWRFVFEPTGALNSIVKALGLGFLQQPNGFLGNTSTSLASVVFVLIWTQVPLAMLLFLTGLQTIPESITEAARVDGASAARTLWSVVLPLLNPVTALVVIIELREALQNYQVFLLMTAGGPVDSSRVLGLKAYDFGFVQPMDLGYASALGWILAVVAMILAVANVIALRSRQ